MSPLIPEKQSVYAILVVNECVTIFNGVVKILHLICCYIFSIITTYLMYTEIIEKLHASNMKFFTYPSNIKVFTSLSYLIVLEKSSSFK